MVGRLRDEMVAAVAAELEEEDGGKTPRLEAVLERLYHRKRWNDSDRVHISFAFGRCKTFFDVAEIVASTGCRLVAATEDCRHGTLVYGTMLDASGLRLSPMTQSPGDEVREKVKLGILSSEPDYYFAYAISCALCRLWERDKTKEVCDRLQEAKARGKAVASQLVEKCRRIEELETEALKRNAASNDFQFALRDERKKSRNLEEAAGRLSARVAVAERELSLAVESLHEARREVDMSKRAVDDLNREADESKRELRRDLDEAKRKAESAMRQAEELRQELRRVVQKSTREVDESRRELFELKRSRGETLERTKPDDIKGTDTVPEASMLLSHDRGEDNSHSRQTVQSLLARRDRRAMSRALHQWRMHIFAKELHYARRQQKLMEDRCAALVQAPALTERSDLLLRDIRTSLSLLFEAASREENEDCARICTVAAERARALAACDAAQVELNRGSRRVYSSGSRDVDESHTSWMLHHEVRSLRDNELLAVLRLSSIANNSDSTSAAIALLCDACGYALESRRALDHTSRALREALQATRRATDSARSRATDAVTRAARASRLVQAVPLFYANQPLTLERVARLLVSTTGKSTAVVTAAPAKAILATADKTQRVEFERDASCLELDVARGVDPNLGHASCLSEKPVCCVRVPDARIALSVEKTNEKDEEELIGLLEAVAALISSSIRTIAQRHRRLRAAFARAARLRMRRAWRVLSEVRGNLAPMRRVQQVTSLTGEATISASEEVSKTFISVSPSEAFRAFARVARDALNDEELAKTSFADALNRRVAQDEDAFFLATSLDAVLKCGRPTLIDAYAALRELEDGSPESSIAAALGVESARIVTRRDDVDDAAAITRSFGTYEVGGECFRVERFGRLARAEAMREYGDICLELSSSNENDVGLGARAAVGVCAVVRAAREAASRGSLAKKIECHEFDRTVQTALATAAAAFAECASSASLACEAARVVQLPDSAQFDKWQRVALECQAQTRSSIAELELAKTVLDESRDAKRASKEALKRAADLAARSRDLETECRRLTDELATTRAAARLARSTLLRSDSDDSSSDVPPPPRRKLTSAKSTTQKLSTPKSTVSRRQPRAIGETPPKSYVSNDNTRTPPRAGRRGTSWSPVGPAATMASGATDMIAVANIDDRDAASVDGTLAPTVAFPAVVDGEREEVEEDPKLAELAKLRADNIILVSSRKSTTYD